MAYAHELRLYEESSGNDCGYVKYNITPAHWATAWEIGTVVNISGVVRCSTFAGHTLELRCGGLGYSGSVLYSVEKTFTKGKTISFSMQFTITKELLHKAIFRNLSKRTPVSEMENYYISSPDGIATAASYGHWLHVYEVTPGETIVIGAEEGTDTYASYMFQNSSIVPTSGVNENLIGSPVSLPSSSYWVGKSTDKLIVPQGATHLIIDEGSYSSYHDSTGVTSQRMIETFFTFSLLGVDIGDTLPSEDIGDSWIVTNRLPPVPSLSFSDLTIGDPQSATARFGGFVQRQSPVTANASITFDPADPSLELVEATLVLSKDGTTLFQETKTTNEAFSVGTLNAGGDVAWSYHMEDSAGMEATANGTISLIPYHVPTLTVPLPATEAVERWMLDLDNNHVPSEDGTNLWCNFNGSVSPITGNGNTNPWSVKVEYTYQYLGQTYTVTKMYNSETPTPHPLGVDSDNTTITFLTGETFSYRRIESVIDPPANTGGVFEETVTYEFSITVTDWFGNSAVLYEFLQNATTFFNVERHGVAVGMRSTGTQDSPKFESAYPAYFYGGIVVGGGSGYSLTPTKIGSWLNTGYDVYQVAVSIPGTSSGNASFTAPKTIQRLVSVEGSGYNGNYWLPIPYAFTSTGNQATFRCEVNGNNCTVNLVTGANQSFVNGTVCAIVMFVC